MRLLVLSDLHIQGDDDPLYRSLLTVLRERVTSGDRLVLAGDVFDLFIGNKEVFLRRYREFVQAVREAGRLGVEIHYIEGNHDFLLRKVFAGAPNVTLHSHSFELQIDGRRFYFAHGDTVDREDYGYRLLRGFLRSPVIRTAVFVAPSPVVERIGSKSSRLSGGKSRQITAKRIEYLRTTYRSFAAERLAEGYDFVVMGHCHDLDEMSFKIGDRTGQYINVGYPREHGSMLCWSPGESAIWREPIP